MRKRYVQIEGVLYERGQEPSSGFMIIRDIEPYQSMVDGSWITSRSKHREHLKAHNCVELGNDLKVTPQSLPDASPQKRKELIVSQFNQMTHDDFKKALKRDIDNVKWNSRER